MPFGIEYGIPYLPISKWGKYTENLQEMVPFMIYCKWYNYNKWYNFLQIFCIYTFWLNSRYFQYFFQEWSKSFCGFIFLWFSNLNHCIWHNTSHTHTHLLMIWNKCLKHLKAVMCTRSSSEYKFLICCYLSLTSLLETSDHELFQRFRKRVQKASKHSWICWGCQGTLMLISRKSWKQYIDNEHAY